MTLTHPFNHAFLKRNRRPNERAAISNSNHRMYMKTASDIVLDNLSLVKSGRLVKDIAGKKFGRITALRFKDVHFRNARWVCKCECGSVKVVYGCHLRSGKVVSCGCFQRERAYETNKTHGCTHDLEYGIWKTMKARCCNPKTKSFANYGGRGIMVCDRWMNSFENFISDMGTRPSRKHSVERKNNNGNYDPSNCVWATQKEQSNNTRSNRILEFNGRRQNMNQWINETGKKAIACRIWRGWSAERAISEPVAFSMMRGKP